MGKPLPSDAYPDVPSSLQHDPIQLQTMDQDGQGGGAAGPAPWVREYDSAGSITPYLGLRGRLSQIWINRWTVLLLLTLVRVVLLTGTLHDDIEDAKVDALAACTKVEDIGSAMASMPHYLSVGVNELAADGISKAVRGMVDILGMVLTGVEQLIMFVINYYIGMYVCLTAALLHGTLDVGIGAADAATKAMNSAIGTITTGLSSDIASIQDTINKAFKDIESAASVFGKSLDPPTIDISSWIDDLHNIHIDDTDFVKSLKTANATIPTYAEAENFTRNAISAPFELVRRTLNNSYGGYQFDTSVFPVARKQALTFCSDNTKINDFFQSLFHVANTARTAFIVVLVVLALLACVPMAVLELRRYRSQLRRARLLARHSYDPMDVVYLASRPYTAGAGIKASARFAAGKRQLLARWAVAYATSLPALFVLSLALAGFATCICIAILLAAVKKEAPALTAQVGDFANDVVKTLEGVSADWANDANGVLLGFQDKVNDDVLGYVVNATTAVNHTLNVFTTEITKGIDAVFNGTVLDNTVQQVVFCIIGQKIAEVEEGLTWVHDHAKVTLPLFPNDTFSSGADKSISSDTSLTSFLSSPSSVTTDEISSAVDKVVTFLRNNLIQEALVSLGLLLVYIIVVLVGVVRAMAGFVMPERGRAEGGQRFHPTAADLHGSGSGSRSSSTASSHAHAGHADADADVAGLQQPFFARFDGSGGGSGGGGGGADDQTAALARDEKRSAKWVPEGQTGQTKSHRQDSSYGDVDYAGR